MKKTYLLILAFFGFFNKGVSQSLSQQQKDIIIEKVQGFNSAVKEYSGLKGLKDSTLYGRILEFKDGSDPQSPIANDLFTGQNVRTVDFINYLNTIDDTYKHQIDVEYDTVGPKILDCIDVKHNDAGDQTFAYVTVKKTLFFREKKKDVVEIVAVNLKNYQIPAVFFPDDSVYNKGVCYNQITGFNNAQPQGNADQSLKNEPQISGRFKNAVKAAELAYNTGDFDTAESQYKAIATKFPGESKKNNISARIDECESAIFDGNNRRAFNKMMDLGNYYFNKGFYKKAGAFYGYALRYSPTDSDALTGLNKCNNMANPQMIITQIHNAEQLEAQTPDNYGEAFRILADAEPSGLLSTRDYYFMIENLYERNPAIISAMGYGDEDCENYLNIYRYKLRLASERERRADVRNDVSNLLGDIIVSNRGPHVFIRNARYYPLWVLRAGNNRAVIINPNRSGYNRIAHNNTNPYRNIKFTPSQGPGNLQKHVFVDNSRFRNNMNNNVPANTNGRLAPKGRTPNVFNNGNTRTSPNANNNANVRRKTETNSNVVTPNRNARTNTNVRTNPNTPAKPNARANSNVRHVVPQRPATTGRSTRPQVVPRSKPASGNKKQY
jgi:tetratricopeptide (TPR) repeat protein